MNPVNPEPVVPCVRRIDSAMGERFVFALEANYNPTKVSGIRTYTRIHADGILDSFEVLDSVFTIPPADTVPDTVALVTRTQVRIPVNPFRTLKGLEDTFWPGSPGLSIAGCAEAWSDTISIGKGKGPSQFFLAGDSLEYKAFESSYDLIGRGGSTSLHYVYHTSRGLLTYEAAFDRYMTGKSSLTLRRIPE